MQYSGNLILLMVSHHFIVASFALTNVMSNPGGLVSEPIFAIGLTLIGLIKT